MSFQDKLIDIGGKMANQKHLQAISKGLMAIMPLTILGSVFQLISAIPDIFTFLPAYSDTIKNAILFPYNMAFGLFGVIATLTITYFFAKTEEADILQSEIVAFLSFMILASPLDSEANTFDATYLGSSGVFLAIIVSLITVSLWKLYDKHGYKIKLPDSIPPYVAGSFNGIIPMLLIVTVFYLFSLAIQAMTGQLFPALIMSVLAPAITASESLWFCMFVAFMIALLQTFGIHGFNVMSGLILPLLVANTGENAAAFAAGETATKIFTLPMFQMSGVFMWIIPVMLLRCKSKKLKEMGKVGLVPSLFNIAEPIQFTVITFNPILGVPWILMYTINMAIVWISMATGFCGKAVIMASSNIPFPFFSYLCTLDWKSVVVFAIMLVVSYLIFKPFISAYDAQCCKEENN